MRLSLRTKISIGLCTMLGVLVLSVMILVNRVTTRAIEGKIRRDLVAARAVFERFQQWRFQELLTSTTMLVDIPHLKAVITTPGLDHATLLDSAQAARELIHSDLLVLSDAQGSLLASVTEPTRFGDDLTQNPAFASALKGESFRGVWMTQGTIYQVVASPFRFGDAVVGAMMAGFAVNEELVGEFVNMTNCQVAFISPEGAVTVSSAGTLFQGLKAVRAAAGDQEAQIRIQRLGGERHLLLAAPFGNTGLSYVLARSLDEALMFYRTLQWGLVLAALGILVVALVCGVWFSGRITRPIRWLVLGTQQIAAGDLAARVHVSSSDEIGELAGAFNQMTQTLQETTVSKQYVDRILESMRDPLVVVTPGGKIQTANPAARELLGYTEVELIGMHIARLFPDGGPHPFSEARFERFLKEGSVRDDETAYRTTRGELIPVSFSGSVMRDASGTPINLVCVARDLREAKKLQAKLLEAEKLAAVGMLGAGMAHELNNPLMGITGLVSLVKGKLEASDQKRRLLEDAERELKRCSKLVTDVLTYARPGFQQAMESSVQVDCEEVIRQSVALLADRLEKRQVTVSTQCAGGLPKIWGNVNQLEQVFVNLIANAADAMATSPRKALTISLRSTPVYVEVRVADTGMGISPEHLPKIFNPFFTTKAVGQGTGLGLSITRSIIEAHQGQMEITSHVGQGTEVLVRLAIERRTLQGEETSHAEADLGRG